MTAATGLTGRRVDYELVNLSEDDRQAVVAIFNHFVGCSFTARARAMGIENLIASVSSLNDQSLRFHRRAGFERCGTLSAVGKKFGRDFDVVLFQKNLAEDCPDNPGSSQAAG